MTWTILETQTGEVETTTSDELAAWLDNSPRHLVSATVAAPPCEHSLTVGYNPNGCSWCGTHR
jgi:hypothetical protein